MKITAHLITAEDGTRLIRYGERGSDPIGGSKLFDNILDCPVKEVLLFAEGELIEVLQRVNRAHKKGQLTNVKYFSQLSVMKEIVRVFDEFAKAN